MEKIEMIETLKAFTGMADKLVSSLEGTLQETLVTLKGVTKEAHGLIDDLVDELLKEEP